MKPGRLGMLSALVASLCCVGPVVLVLLGLGGLGVGAMLGRFHGWFLLGAMMLLGFAWRRYTKETRRCRAASCEMAQGKTTRGVLTLASAVVALFVGLNLYTYAGQHRYAQPRATGDTRSFASVAIPVEGMTCFTCQLAVEAAVKTLPGVREVRADVMSQRATVSYDPR